MNEKEFYYNILHKKFDSIKAGSGIYQTELSAEPLYDTAANFLIAISLYFGGWVGESRTLINNIESSHLKNKDGFYNRQGTKTDIITHHHSYVEGVASFFYGISGSKEKASYILKRLFFSKLYNIEIGLFHMSIDEDEKIIDGRIIAHSQLWIKLALIINNQNKKAEKLLLLLEKHYMVKNTGILKTMYCATKSTENNTLPDDTALFAIANFLIGKTIKARKILVSLKNSSLFDKKRNIFIYKNNAGAERISSYKNFLCQAAYNLCGVEILQYDIKNEERFSDSIALGILSCSIKQIKYNL